MHIPTNFIYAIVGSVFGSVGFWQLVTYLVQHRRESPEQKMLKGLAYDRITHLCEEYIARGYVTKGELGNLTENLYQPYKGINGDGMVDTLYEVAIHLPIKSEELERSAE